MARCLSLATLLALGGFALADTPQETLDARLRVLEKRIEDARGLKYKTPVTGRIIPRPDGGMRGLQGYYDIKAKTLFVYDDVKGNYELGVLVHEMVHALQDQHFGLKKLHEMAYGGDAELALAALVEGDATFTMIEVLKKEQPRAGGMLDMPLEKAKNLQTAFLYAQGARYVKALKERGGWEAVNFAYKFTPRSTSSILHPEGASTIDLGPGDKRGEFGLIKLLAEQPATAGQAVQSVTGYRGDRLVQDKTGSHWTIAFATSADAERFRLAWVKQHEGKEPKGKLVPHGPGGSLLSTEGGPIFGIHQRDHRLVIIEAPDLKDHHSRLDQAEGPLKLRVFSRADKREISFGEMMDRLLAADLVCIGEDHDSDLHHRVQLQILKGLFAQDERLALGMEMFQRPFQKEIDRYLSGACKEDEFLKASEYQQRWGYDWSLYRPLVEFCRKNNLPVAALNAPRELTKRVSKVGVASLTAEEKKQLGPVDFQLKEHRDYWFERLAKMHGQTKVSEEQKEKSYQVMTIWDDYMAQSAAAFQQERGVRRLVVLAGSGHIDRGFGIPQRAVRLTGGKALTVGIQLGGEAAKAFAEPVNDFVILVP